MINAKHPLSVEALAAAFTLQLSILYSAKKKMASRLPALIEQAAFHNLKLALEEDLTDTRKQLHTIQEVFAKLNKHPITANDLGIGGIITEAENQIGTFSGDTYQSDMSIIFYMNAVENLQTGAFRVVDIIARHPAFTAYRQQVLETLDINRDNARLFKLVAAEYLN